MKSVKDRYNILFITPWYPTIEKPTHGIFIREHAKSVQIYDEIVVLHIAERNPPQKKYIEIREENDQNLNEGIQTYRYTNKPTLIPYSTIFLEVLGGYKAIKMIKERGFKPDIIHAHILRAGFISIFLGKLFKCAVVITEHNSAFPRQLLSKVDIYKSKYAFPRANKVLPVSKALQKGIEGYHIRARFHIIPNVVDTSLFFPNYPYVRDENAIRLIFVGSLLPVKGLDYLLRSLSTIKIKQNWHLDIFGTGSQEIKYKQLCSELGLNTQITFHGYQVKTKIAEGMRNSDIFVLPSLYETMGCVIIEAMASGLPIVSTNVGGIPEFVDKNTGILCKPGDIESLHNALISIIEKLDSYNRNEISKKAIRFSPIIVGQQLHDIYSEILSSK